MTTDNGFQPDRPPIFLTERMDEDAGADIEKRWDVAAASSRILKASALAAAVTTIGVGALSVGNPVALVANVTDWWNDKPALQIEADMSASTLRATSDAQEAAAATDEAAREEVAVVAAPADPSQADPVQRQAEPVQVQPLQAQVEPPRQAEAPRPAEVAQSQTENGPPVSAELFRQFQAWAAEDDARKGAGSAPATPARVAQETQHARPAKKQRRAHSVQNARAEVRPQRQQRTRARDEQDREPTAPAADPRAPDPAAQPAQPPSFFQSLGFR